MSENSSKQTLEDTDDSRYKRRMLGAVILIAMSVIFLPLIFDGSGTERQLRSIEPLSEEPAFDMEVLRDEPFPERGPSPAIEFIEDRQITSLPNTGVAAPDTSSVVVKKKNKPAPTPPVKAARRAVTSSPKTVAKKLSKKTPAKVQSTPRTVVQVKKAQLSKDTKGSWLIQTASFRDKINALSLRSDLKQFGFSVSVKVAESQGKTIYRVYVGPVVGEAKARKVKASVEAKLNRKTLLVAQ
jgi:DedD protein